MSLKLDCSVACKTWKESEGEMAPNQRDNMGAEPKRPSIEEVDATVEIQDPKNKVVAFEDALKEIGFGKVQVQLLFMIALILLTVLNETMGISFIIPAAQCDLNLTTRDKGLVSSMTFLGIMISSYFWGFLGDTQGRRIIILISLFFSTTFTLLSAFMKSFTLFVICRFVTGVFVSGYSATVYAYIGEFNTDKNRAAIISWVSVAIGISAIFEPMTALWVLSYDWRYELYDGYEFRPWRLLLLIYAAPGILGGLWLYKFPESPKFLLSQSRNDEALEVVRWMYRRNKGERCHDDLWIGKLKAETSGTLGKSYKGAKAIVMLMVNQTFPLFKPPYLVKFFACSFLHFGTFTVAGGMAMFLPDILNRLSQARDGNDALELRICDVLHAVDDVKPVNGSEVADIICIDSVDAGVFYDSAVVGVGYLIGFVTLSLSIKALGRRVIFVFTLVASGVSGILLTFTTSHMLIILLSCSFILFSGLNVSVINGAACDIFPTHLRAMAVCVSMLFGRLGSVTSTNLIGFLLESYCELTYYSFSGIMFLCLAVSFLVPS